MDPNGSGRNYYLSSGAFGNLGLHYPNPPENLNNILGNSSSYEKLRLKTEKTLNNAVYQGIGDDMTIWYVPSDPISWIQIAIDYIWLKWQRINPNHATNFQQILILLFTWTFSSRTSTFDTSSLKHCCAYSD